MFEFYRRFDKPYFNVCLRVDVTELLQELRRREEKLSAWLTYHYLALRAANDVEPVSLIAVNWSRLAAKLARTPSSAARSSAGVAGRGGSVVVSTISAAASGLNRSSSAVPAGSASYPATWASKSASLPFHRPIRVATCAISAANASLLAARVKP